MRSMTRNQQKSRRSKTFETKKKKGKKGKSSRATAVSIYAKLKLSHDILMPAKVHLASIKGISTARIL